MIIDLVPIDAEGIRLDRPSHEVKWRKLTNVNTKDGSLVPRVGFKEVGQLTSNAFPSVEIGPVLAIAEILNPGSSATGRESWTPLIETLTPDGSSDIVAGWTGSHTDIDETSPPDGLFLETSTEGAQKGITYSNLAGSPSAILGIMIKGLARLVTPGGTAVLELFNRVSSTNHSLGTVTISENDYASESKQWQFFSLFSAINPATSKQWEVSEINALELVIEYDSGDGLLGELAVPGADGNYTGWTDDENGGSATYTDFSTGSWALNDGQTSTDPNGAISTSTDDRQSWDWATLSADFDAITQINIFLWFRDFGSQEHEIEIFYRNGGTDYTVATETFGRHGYKVHQISVTSATNPETSSAWTKAQVSGGEFGIRNVSGNAIVLTSASVYVEGSDSDQGVQVESLLVEVSGVTDTITGTAMLATERLFSSNVTHIRMDNDRPGSVNVTDVTNSVPLDNSFPIAPLDHTVLYGQLYMVNGVDPTVYYPNGSDVFAELASNNGSDTAALTGRTVEAFADRILYGWTKDGSTVTPERVSYSRIFNGQDHSDDSAGDFDLIDTPGGVVALKTLNESLCFCGKEIGVYALRRSGNSRAPIIPDPIDYETRCLAMGTVQRALDPTGRPIILFLGWNPSVGANVFQFDGTSVIPVGDPIAPAIRDDAAKNGEYLRFSCAGIEPISGSYWLAFAEGTNGVPNTGYAMDLRTRAWTRFELPFFFVSMGSWHTPDFTTLPATAPAIFGLPRLLLGGLDNKPYRSDDKITWDALSTPSESMTTDADFFTVDSAAELVGRNRQVFTCEMETGDFRNVMPEDEMGLVQWRLHVIYTNLGPFSITVKASEDGGITFPEDSSTTFYLGDMDVNKKKYHAVLDIDALNSERTRINIQIAPSTDRSTHEHFWQIDEMYLEVTGGGRGGH